MNASQLSILEDASSRQDAIVKEFDLFILLVHFCNPVFEILLMIHVYHYLSLTA